MSTVLAEEPDEAFEDTAESKQEKIVTAPEPEPKKPSKNNKEQEDTAKPCKITAKGEFDGGVASLEIDDKKSDIDLNRTQKIVLGQVGRKYVYTRTDITNPEN
jgi:hypothetical protein